MPGSTRRRSPPPGSSSTWPVRSPCSSWSAALATSAGVTRVLGLSRAYSSSRPRASGPSDRRRTARRRPSGSRRSAGRAPARRAPGSRPRSSPAEQGVLAGRVARHVRRPAEGRGAGHETRPGARPRPGRSRWAAPGVWKRTCISRRAWASSAAAEPTGAVSTMPAFWMAQSRPEPSADPGRDPAAAPAPEVRRQGAGLATGLGQPHRGSPQALLAATQSRPSPQRPGRRTARGRCCRWHR